MTSPPLNQRSIPGAVISRRVSRGEQFARYDAAVVASGVDRYSRRRGAESGSPLSANSSTSGAASVSGARPLAHCLKIPSAVNIGIASDKRGSSPSPIN